MVTMIVRGAESLFPGTLEPPPADFPGTFGSFEPAHEENMRTAEYNGLLEGVEGFGRSWDPWASATRGEMAQVIYNWMVVAGMLGVPEQ
jgi:hypothetical protein